MVTRNASVVLALALLVSAGCTQPAPSTHGLMQSLSGAPVVAWDASAHGVAMNMEALGVIATPMHPPLPGQVTYPGPYYVFVQQPGSPFLEQVRGKLEDELLRSGADVVRSPVGATVINLDLNVVGQTVMWHAMIVSNRHVLLKMGDQLNISYNDIGLYLGTAALAPLSSPGVSVLGAAMPLRYAH